MSAVLLPVSPRASTPRLLRRLVATALAVTLLLVPFGAWVRLSDAGLGCPDWPGCYGRLTPVHAAEDIARAVAAQGGEHGPVSMGKAWREMLHRYVASGLGLACIGIAALAVARRRELSQSPALPVALLGVVVLQGLFGKWTVTLLLKPAIVTGHLLGGMTVLAMLAWLWNRQHVHGAVRVHGTVARRRIGGPFGALPTDPEPLAQLRGASWAALGLLFAQVALGGWVSTNHAALACADLPTCQGRWLPDMDFASAFHLVRDLGRSPDGGWLSLPALTAIHWTHRVGALVVTLVLGALAIALARAGERCAARWLALALALQVALGLANVLGSLPLGLAVAHNAGAAVLVALLVSIVFRATLAARVA